MAVIAAGMILICLGIFIAQAVVVYPIILIGTRVHILAMLVLVVVQAEVV